MKGCKMLIFGHFDQICMQKLRKIFAKSESVTLFRIDSIDFLRIVNFLKIIAVIRELMIKCYMLF